MAWARARELGASAPVWAKFFRHSLKKMPKVFRSRMPMSHPPAPVERLRYGHLVDVIDVGSHGKPHGDSAHLDSERLDQGDEVRGRRLAVDRRIRGDDHLPHRSSLQPVEEVGNPHLVPANAMDGPQ